ncbi:LYR motif-containing protein 1-like [Macrotis lagotis]|uniref:LYR motif-containing protein 1-like n=1 Tax=Macrotis lagotis TaxID=92651 RepID=UPI003D684B5E
MTIATQQEFLSLFQRIFRLARKWHVASGQMEKTIRRKFFFQKNKNLMDSELLKQCIDESIPRIEIELHYQIPYPRPFHLPPMVLTTLQIRDFKSWRS